MTQKTKRSKPYKVLIVDDSKAILALLKDAFADTPYEVHAVTNPLLAYKLIEDEGFNIVVSDIEMPELNGLDLLQKIKEHNGMIQVIIITGFITVNNTLNAFRYGAFDMVLKPFDSQEVVASVDRAAEKLDWVNHLLAQAIKKRK